MSDLTKILYVLSKIMGKGFAMEWANMKAEEILSIGLARTWENFIKELKQAFDNPNNRVIALNN